MKEMNKNIWLGLMLGVGLGAGWSVPVAKAEVSCTATPDCAALGYNKEAADCPEGGVKCPFNPVKMFCLKKGGGNNFTVKNKYNNLDIVYSDGTSSPTLSAGKDAIGVAVVTETNAAFNHGYIVSIHQPVAAKWADAVKRCNDYVIKGTSEGDWQLPNLMDMMMINGWETETSTGTNQYTALNDKIKTIPEAEQIGYSNSFNYCNTGSPDNGGTYLNGTPSCTDGVDVSIKSSCFINVNSSYDSTNNSCYSCYYYGMASSSCINSSQVLTFPGAPKNFTLTSDYYFTVSEMPSSTFAYHIKLGATNGEKVINGNNSTKNFKGLYRCILRF